MDGLEAGRAEDVMEGILNALKSLMKNSGMTIDKAMVMLSVPESEQERYIEMLRN